LKVAERRHQVNFCYTQRAFRPRQRDAVAKSDGRLGGGQASAWKSESSSCTPSGSEWPAQLPLRYCTRRCRPSSESCRRAAYPSRGILSSRYRAPHRTGRQPVPERAKTKAAVKETSSWVVSLMVDRHSLIRSGALQSGLGLARPCSYLSKRLKFSGSVSGLSCSNVHCRGALSGRKRTSLVP